jgi:predicted esterase YcpF (UPF0227 family)
MKLTPNSNIFVLLMSIEIKARKVSKNFQILQKIIKFGKNYQFKKIIKYCQEFSNFENIIQF